jgi:hypothetical protein
VTKGCEKEHTFNTRAQAYYAMLKVPIKDSGQMPFRVYYCKEHKGFHYTSKAVFKNAERGKLDAKQQQRRRR